MKRLEDYTTEEKVELFDRTYKSCLSEINDSAAITENDDHYFWEGTIEDFLQLTQEDWNAHNCGEKLPI